jgi:pentatricopeptide repeat protein
MGQTEKAIEALEQCIATHKASVDYHLINILVELYMGNGEFEKAIALINKISAQRADTLPVDIIVSLGICEIYTGDLNSAEVVSR